MDLLVGDSNGQVLIIDTRLDFLHWTYTILTNPASALRDAIINYFQALSLFIMKLRFFPIEKKTANKIYLQSVPNSIIKPVHEIQDIRFPSLQIQDTNTPSVSKIGVVCTIFICLKLLVPFTIPIQHLLFFSINIPLFIAFQSSNYSTNYKSINNEGGLVN
jgi:hypothetical protein